MTGNSAKGHGGARLDGARASRLLPEECDSAARGLTTQLRAPNKIGGDLCRYVGCNPQSSL